MHSLSVQPQQQDMYAESVFGFLQKSSEEAWKMLPSMFRYRD
jgi:hypothetical protein